MKDLPHRNLLVAAVVAVLLAALAVTASAVLAVAGGRHPEAARPSETSGPSGPSGGTSGGRWWSGASGRDAATGRFATWRGEPLAIGGAWVNGDDEQQRMFEICDPKADWARWTGRLDLAVGAIDTGRGETWAAAAKGAYDARWRAHLQRTKQCWGRRDTALLYLRFAHEMNSTRMPWRVRPGEEKAFAQAVARYSALRRQVLPRAHVVLCARADATAGAGGATGADVRALWPGVDAQRRPIVDVYAVDLYDAAPHPASAADFAARAGRTADGGAPVGLEAHRRLAGERGVPFAVTEWGATGGESEAFVQAFHAWAGAHAGDPARPAAGQLLYEIHFDAQPDYALWPTTSAPRTAAAYRALTWGVAAAAG